MRAFLAVFMVFSATLMLTGAVAGLEVIGQHSEYHATRDTVIRWDSAGWQSQSDGTAFRTALDSRGQYTEVTCQRPADGLTPLTRCTATADDGSHPYIPASLLRQP